MFEELKGKKLLVLGGTAWSDFLFDFARENGIHLLTTGKNPNKKYDEIYYIDSTNHEDMKNLIRERKVDGVYVGSNETVIRHAIQYLAELEMPCFCTFDQWEALMNKRKFKDLCNQFGLPVVQKYDFRPDKPCDVAFPVITKPADGCGSLGIMICNDEVELLRGYQFAYNNSPSKEVLIEKYVNNSGMIAFFQIVEGNVEWRLLGDNYPIQLRKGFGSIVGARVFPSVYTEEFREKYEEKIKKLLTHLELRHGLIWMEVFHDGDNYYFNEAGYRINGGLSIVGIDYLCGINVVATDMYYALTGKGITAGLTSLLHNNCMKNKKKVCEYQVASNSGKISSIEGIERLRSHPGVLAVFPKYSEGDTIPLTNGFAQNFCVVHIAYDTPDELERVIRFIRTTVRVNDSDGNDMIIHKSNSFINRLLMDN